MTATPMTGRRDAYPAAVRSLLTDRDSLTVYLRFPREHCTGCGTSNFIDHTFGESRRQVKVIARLPGEHSCLSLGGRRWIAPAPRGVDSP